MSSTVPSFLRACLSARLTPDIDAWVTQSCQLIESGDAKQLALRFGLASRRVGKAQLELTPDERNEAEILSPGWNPGLWSLTDAVRTLFVLSFPHDDPAVYQATLDKLFATGEVAEMIALYQALPLLPCPERFVDRAGEGIRTNIKSVFAAVAHHNSFPAAHLAEGMWNQMVLKCLFVELSLFPIVGLDARRNAELSRMLSDYAHERWAAKRSVHPELWRCVDIDLTPAAEQDFQKVIREGSAVEQEAVGLSLARSKSAAAHKLLAEIPEIAERIKSGKLSWESLVVRLAG